MRKILILVLVLLAFNFIDNNNTFDDTAVLNNVEMKPFSVPIQEELTDKEKQQEFVKTFFGGKSIIKPLYKYKIYARIYSKKAYPFGFDPNPAPYDLALGWDGLEKEDIFETINVRQSFRWVHWRLKSECPYNVDGVYLRLANNHVIPANNNILRAIKMLKKKDVVYLEGYLVSYTTTRGNLTGTGKSSTTRTDRQGGSCEIVYVTRLVSKYGDFK